MTSTPAPESSETVSRRVVERVAEATDTDPLDLEPLYDVVDPDSLDRLFHDAGSPANRTGGRITFPLAGCTVVVTADGRVTVDPENAGQRTTAAEPGDDASPRAAESPD